eukprot:5072712-Amphidinium_carterae.1
MDSSTTLFSMLCKPLRRINADNIELVMWALLPGEEKFIPLVHHYTGMLGGAACDLATLILRDLATKSAVADGVQWQTAIGRITNKGADLPRVDNDPHEVPVQNLSSVRANALKRDSNLRAANHE